ncbi:phosphatidylserine decarboxylase [Floccifex sp.]|uniref:phosphatidylserine decarboxylase n=1 Tax=Floccifex sp. TaxID=2815810 RepID=UPI003F0AD915
MDSVKFLYGTTTGRFLLKILMVTHFDCVIVAFLKSRLSYPFISMYAKKHNVKLSQRYSTFQKFFIRSCKQNIDKNPSHFISPCDGWLSSFSISKDCSFFIKGSYYKIDDFLQDKTQAQAFQDGTLLVFRLCPNDYHRYCYIDDGIQTHYKYIEGTLHSVQPIVCETYPVYTLNRRTCSILETKHFGTIAQCEIGAFVVGGIVNHIEKGSFQKGEEKGYFDLAGSTIVLLIQKGKMTLKPEYISNEEIRVKIGSWIGS